MLRVRKRTLSGAFFGALLLTEFYYVQIGGGVARIYHFLAAVSLIVLLGCLPKVFRSRVFWALALFWGVNLLAASLAERPEAAFVSFLALTANVGVAVATALILFRGRLDLPTLKQLIVVLTVVSVAWAVMQLMTWRVAGVSLALSAQQESQIVLGLAPAFRTEANTFAKFLAVPFFLLLPDLVRVPANRRITGFYVVLIVGMLLSFTRSALYGTALTLCFAFLWYLVRGRGADFSARWLKLSSIGLAGVGAYAAGLLGESEYGLHKLSSFFSTSEILEGGSSAFRIKAMEVTWSEFLASEKTFLIGNGWGQIFMQHGDDVLQSGGGDLLVALGYGGIAGGFAYLAMIVVALTAASRMARASSDPEMRRFAEGVVFALFGIFVISQMSGSFIAPELWMLIGVTIFIGACRQTQGMFQHA